MRLLVTFLGMYLGIVANIIANNNYRVFHIKFPTGSAELTLDVKKSALITYNEIAEQHYARVFCTGEGEELFSSAEQSSLCQDRTNVLLLFFKSKGMASKHLIKVYSPTAHLLIFKPLGKLSSSSAVNLDYTEANTEVYNFGAKNGAVFESKNHSLILIKPNSFFLQGSKTIPRGDVKMELFEVSNVKDELKIGITGKQMNGAKDNHYFHLRFTSNGKELDLRPHHFVEIYAHTSDSLWGERAQVNVGTINDSVIIWRSDLKSNIHASRIDSLQEKGYFYHLKVERYDWLLIQLSPKAYSSKRSDLCLKSREQFMVYGLSEDNTLVTADKNSSFINYYQIKGLRDTEYKAIVGISKQNPSSYIYQEGPFLSKKCEVIEVNSCSTGQGVDCIPGLKQN